MTNTPENNDSYKLFEANDIAKYGIMSMAGKTLSPIAYKALMYLIWKCNQKTPGVFDVVQLSVSELCSVLGYSKDASRNLSHAKQKICAVVKNLMSQQMTIHDAANDMYLSFVWIQTAAVSYKNDHIAVRFNWDVAKYFGHDLQHNFTVVHLRYLFRLHSSSAVTLYPFLCRYLNLRTFNYSVCELSLLLTGNTNYEYKYLKRDYLAPAIKAINRHTNLQVNYKEIKKDRKVSTLSFQISQAPAEDEMHCYMLHNALNYDDLSLMPYNTKWMSKYTYDMASQSYIPIQNT